MGSEVECVPRQVQELLPAPSDGSTQLAPAPTAEAGNFLPVLKVSSTQPKVNVDATQVCRCSSCVLGGSRKQQPYAPLNSEMLLLTDCRRYYLSNSKHGATKTAHPTRLDLLLGSRVGNGLYVRPGRRVHQYIADKLTKC
ncbi:hypothetical protein ZWY2020_038313 [Hordeum vulgare]|nr:hypothetical protein ZWY2020_038313 [Hordeum vulgare]